MARVAVRVIEYRLREAVRWAEVNGPFENRKALWKRVAMLYNATDGADSISSAKAPPAEPITPAVAASRAREFRLMVKTPVGTTGRPKGAKNRPKPIVPQTRDEWGKLAWDAWTRAGSIPAPYSELADADREAWCQVAETIVRMARSQSSSCGD